MNKKNITVIFFPLNFKTNLIRLISDTYNALIKKQLLMISKLMLNLVLIICIKRVMIFQKTSMPKLVAGSNLGFDDYCIIRVQVSLLVKFKNKTLFPISY